MSLHAKSQSFAKDISRIFGAHEALEIPPKPIAQKTKPLVVKIISNLKKIISKITLKRLLIILGRSNLLIIGRITWRKIVTFLKQTDTLVTAPIRLP